MGIEHRMKDETDDNFWKCPHCGAVEEFDAVQAAASQWISVKDRLPEIGENGFSEDVLLQTQFGEMHVSCFENITREIRVEWGDAGFLSLDDFSHWMPLPKPPEE